MGAKFQFFGDGPDPENIALILKARAKGFADSVRDSTFFSTATRPVLELCAIAGRDSFALAACLRIARKG